MLAKSILPLPIKRTGLFGRWWERTRRRRTRLWLWRCSTSFPELRRWSGDAWLPPRPSTRCRIGRTTTGVSSYWSSACCSRSFYSGQFPTRGVNGAQITVLNHSIHYTGGYASIPVRKTALIFYHVRAAVLRGLPKDQQFVSVQPLSSYSTKSKRSYPAEGKVAERHLLGFAVKNASAFIFSKSARRINQGHLLWGRPVKPREGAKYELTEKMPPSLKRWAWRFPC